MYGFLQTALEIAVVNQKCVHEHFPGKLSLRYETKFLENSSKANLEASYNKLTRGNQEGKWMATLLKSLQSVLVDLN